MSDLWASVAERDEAASARPHFDAVTSIRHAHAYLASCEVSISGSSHQAFRDRPSRTSSWPRPCTTARGKGYEIRRDDSQVDSHTQGRPTKCVSRRNAPW